MEKRKSVGVRLSELKWQQYYINNSRNSNNKYYTDHNNINKKKLLKQKKNNGSAQKTNHTTRTAYEMLATTCGWEINKSHFYLWKLMKGKFVYFLVWSKQERKFK